MLLATSVRFCSSEEHKRTEGYVIVSRVELTTLVVICTDCIGSNLYIQLQYDNDHDDPNNSFGVDQRFKMAISHGQSLHCSLMGNSFSSLGENELN
jgi:hypothetical protein